VIPVMSISSQNTAKHAVNECPDTWVQLFSIIRVWTVAVLNIIKVLVRNESVAIPSLQYPLPSLPSRSWRLTAQLLLFPLISSHTTTEAN